MLRKNDFKEILQEKLNIALFDNSDFNERKALSSVENFYTEFGFNIPPKHLTDHTQTDAREINL